MWNIAISSFTMSSRLIKAPSMTYYIIVEKIMGITKQHYFFVSEKKLQFYTIVYLLF